jgi:Reverse transcriptase (RNA-dependent DNA polymerase)
VVFISSYVDDYLITGSDTQGIRDLKAAIAGRFKMKDIGHCVSYLGMEIKREGEKIHLYQAKYTTQLLKDIEMWDVKTKATPIESGEELQPVETEKTVRQEDFRRLIRKIQ